MKKYLKIYSSLLKINLSYLTAYRANFYNSLISSVIWGVFNITVIYLLTAKTATLGSWTRDEMLLLAAAYALFTSIFHMFFAKNFEEFYEIIDKGKLDTILLKPVNSQFMMTMKHIRYAHIIRFFLSLALMFYLLYVRMEYYPSAWQYAGFFVVLLLGVTVIYSIWFMVATIIIWNTRLSNVIELLYNTTSVSRYPQDIFRELSILLFFVVFPFTLVINAPVKLLVGRDYLEDLIWIIVLSIVFFYAAQRFWKYALKSYSSASS